MNRFRLEYPEKAPAKDADDPFSQLLQQRGYDHEDALEAKFAKTKSLIKIEGESPQEKKDATIEAMRSGVEVIVQARLTKAPFAGFADFLIKVRGNSDLGRYHYEVWDTKLSSKLKPEYLVQLCCYAEMLEQMQGVRPAHISIALGNGQTETLRTSDYYAYYQSLKASFLADQDSFDPSNIPSPAESANHGSWSEHAAAMLVDQDHLAQIATITKAHIEKLNKADILTVAQLVDPKLTVVPGIKPEIFQRIKAQATIQYQSRGLDKPLYEILPTVDGKPGLASLPPHSPLDVFFDIEGFPLDEGGLEYLWGCTFFDEAGDRQFKDFWAHDAQQEKQSFTGFVQWVYEHWVRDPNMHIYHYANYEIAACRKLMQRYGVCEYEVDQLLRNEVFVDLYKIVKSSLLIGEPRYSIKNVEHLYRHKRDTAVEDGGASVVFYDQWRQRNALGQEGDTWQTSDMLRDIRNYNIDDCESTQELTAWLRHEQSLSGTNYIGKTESIEPEIKEEITKRIELRDRLLTQSAAEQAIDPKLSAITENLAWMLEFHRRENKPVFWRQFDRLSMDEEELFDDLDCLALCARTDRKPFPIKRSQGYEFKFDSRQEFKITTDSFFVLGEFNVDGKAQKASIHKESSDFLNGLIVIKSTTPVLYSMMTLIPDNYVNPEPMPQAISEVVATYEKGGLKNSAILGFLNRSVPNISLPPGTDIVTGETADERLTSVINAACNLNNSYLPIQGPPGSGKSYTGKYVIAELMRRGKKVGICSNSHKAINNLLVDTAKFCQQEQITAKFMCTRNTGPEIEEYGVACGTNGKLADFVDASRVIGTTAWGFSRDDMADKLDYLFIDEAGQVSVANLIAISRSASNLVLLGDQMQLGQPTQGTHPKDSGTSILDYLLHEKPTIDPDHGVFLATTYRMHSAINAFISEAIYEGKLHSNPDNDLQKVSVPDSYQGPINKEAGIVFIPVEHTGNSQASDEEVATIQAATVSLLGRTFTDKNKAERKIGWHDILFIAPYNFQVGKLTAALATLPGGENARVGSVDKFQGQEAPIVVLSMCSSAANESPRGIDFLFDKNRLNVAISRAQSLAIVVANPELAKTSANNVKQLAKVNMFCQLANYSAD